MKRKGLSKKIRFEVFKRDSFTCQYCGKTSPSVVLVIDHIHPVSMGGDESDILNLITSCEECNSGKGDRLISDGSVLERQISQLKEINEKKEQLELLLKWKEELGSLSEKCFEAVMNVWDKEVRPWHLTEGGKKIIEKLLHKHGIEKLLDAIQSSCNSYLIYDNEGQVIKESVELAFDKITLFLKLQSLPEQMREFYYVRGILKKRLTYFSEFNQSYSMELMEEAYSAGISIEEIKNLATSVKNWSEFSMTLHDWMLEEV
jgi:hypothetical protein